MSTGTIRNLGNGNTAEREALQATVNRLELVERIGRAIRDDGWVEPMRGVTFFRVSNPTEQNHGQIEPALCVVAQGCKEIWLGENCYRYNPANYLLVTTELPVASQVVEASPERPYLALRLNLDPTLVGAVMVEAGYSPPRKQAGVRAMDVSPLDGDLLDTLVRLVRLVDSPAEARFLAPTISREIVFRLLMSEQGNRLRHFATLGGQTHRIAGAINRLRCEYDQPLRIEVIARDLGMSVSGFHHQFKAVTAMSPLQFQKRLRLQEARRLMLGEGLDAASAGFRVGYDDASHFNREYKKVFGLPPIRDIERLRTSVGPAAVA